MILFHLNLVHIMMKKKNKNKSNVINELFEKMIGHP